METIKLTVQGMTCGGCVKSVERILRAIDGVQHVQVSLENGSANVEYDAKKTNAKAFKLAIEDAGYEVAI
jgi:copper chaperone